MAARKRIWLYDPDLNYQNKRCLLVDTAFINEDNTLYTEDNAHFNYGDFVNASCVSLCPVAVLSRQPNYMVVKNGDTIESRWYVMSMQFISGEVSEDKNKWSMTLLRDVIVDNRETIRRATMRIDRGNQKNFPELRFKYDQLALNEIKTAQHNIYDWSGQAQWIGIFYDPKVTETTVEWNRDNLVVSYTEAQINELLAGTGFVGSASTYYIGVRYSILQSLGAEFLNPNIGLVWTKGKFFRSIELSSASDLESGNYIFSTIRNEVTRDQGIEKENFRNDVSSFNVTKWWSENKWIIESYQVNRMEAFKALKEQLNGKYVSYPNGKIRRISFSEGVVENKHITLQEGTEQKDLLYALGKYGFKYANTIESSEFFIQQTQSTNILFHSVNSENIRMTLPQRTTLDESFVRFACVPINVPIKAGGITYESLANEVVSGLITNGFSLAGSGTNSFIKDVVRLPYCPIKALNDRHSGESTPQRTVIDLDVISSWSNITAPIFSGTNIIGYAIEESVSSQDYRLLNALDIQANDKERYYKKCRFRSPNHMAFDVNPNYNLGITDVSLSFTLRPLKTTYAIAPVWKGMYGQMFKDDRYAITEGGISYTQTTDAWTNYQLTNSTYQETFNASIRSLEYSADARLSMNLLASETQYNNSKIAAAAARERSRNSAEIAAISSGMMAADGKYTSASMGAFGTMNAYRNADVSFKASMQQIENSYILSQQHAAMSDAIASNQIQLQRDTFNLTNIAMRAAPTVLGRTSDFTIITAEKFYVEVYECLEIEKSFLNDFIRYNGELIEMITNDVTQYIINDGDYLEGFCIYLPGLMPKMTEAINAELRRGRYYALNVFASEE